MTHGRRPYWQLPPGVTRGLWDYVQKDTIADDYDAFFAFNELFEFDERVLEEVLPGSGRREWVVDLGCGTGRALIPLLRRGFQGVAVDLSPHMLRIVTEKAAIEQLPVLCVRANLTELQGLADEFAHHGVCLFSTLGMISGRDTRQRALQQMRRVIRRGGTFIVHVHNYWFNLFDPGGPWWLIKNMLRAALVRDVELGDKYFYYRGISNMFLHAFRRGEIERDLRRAGFRIERAILLDKRRQKELRYPWWLGRIRSNGWIFICR